eukprot:526753-Rhodomonas_salina.1
MGAIIGMPWLQRNGVKVYHADKTARFSHSNSEVVLLPTNPVFPAPQLEPIKALPPWITTASAQLYTASGSNATPSPGNGFEARSGPKALVRVPRETHLPAPAAAKAMVAELRRAMRLGREEYYIQVVEMEAQGIFLPSSRSLSSMNVFDLVEVNTLARFEKALRKQTQEEALDCCTIFFRGHDADTLEISDLPFPSYA